MQIEVIIYIYGAVCLCMIAFNIVYNLAMKRSKPRLEKRCRKLQKQVDKQLDVIRRGSCVEQRHLRYLQRRLRRVRNLMAFDRVLKPLCDKKQDGIGTAYLSQLQPVVLYLAVLYLRREPIQAAYFSFFLSQYVMKRQRPIDSVQTILLDYVGKGNLYCSVNALQALYSFGSVEHISKALKVQDESGVFVHEKILTEGLLSFTGNHDELIRRLLTELDSFSERTQLAILNYIRFRTGGYKKEMFALMQDSSKGKELRLAAIRYFGRYEFEPALDPLLSFASDKDPIVWEYAVVAISSLSRYRDERVIKVMKEALHSSDWYIRQSAAAGLESLELDYESLNDVIVGNDRYAREMMTYRLESRRLQRGGEKI